MTKFIKREFIRLSFALSVLIIIISFQPLRISLASTDPGSGPGGVDSTDGTGNLVLWLDANGITGDDGSFLSTWNDKSGWGNHASQSTMGNQPTLQTLELNNQSVARFDGLADFNEGDWLNISDADELDNTSGLTIFTVINPSGGGESVMGILSKRVYWLDKASYTIFFENALCSNTNCMLYDIDNNSMPYNRFTSDPYTFTNNIPAQVTVWYDGTQPLSKIMRNASTLSSSSPTSTSIPNYASNLTLGTMNEGYDSNTGIPHFYQGDIAEVIIYRKALNSAEHVLVENYLSSKFNIDIDPSGLDRFDGDTPANGNFDLDVAGIGLEADGSNSSAFSKGMIVQNNSFLADNGDYLLFGHGILTNTITTNDIPWIGDPSAYRWSRHWYMDVTDITIQTGGTVDIAFDYSDAGIAGSPVGDGSNFRLLKRSGTSGVFSELVYSASIVGDRVGFSGVSISDFGSNITLGFASNPPLRVFINGTGSGTVTSNPAGIDCDPDCIESFGLDEVVTLIATPATGSTFSGWAGEGCSGTGTCEVTMDAARSVTATFTINTFTLSVSKNGTGQGTVSSNPAGIDCGTTCSADFDHNTPVTLTALAATGSTFSSWSIPDCTDTYICIISLDADMSVTASFEHYYTYLPLIFP